MKVRAKFKVRSVAQHENGVSSVQLYPVTSGSDENKDFFKWTPGGEIRMDVVKPEVAAQFVPGAEVYVDFTPAGGAS